LPEEHFAGVTDVPSNSAFNLSRQYNFDLSHYGPALADRSCGAKQTTGALRPRKLYDLDLPAIFRY